ncbi:putative aminoadipate reductase [Lentinula raphanica]|nr:putative aminoadipate reductase [Lentinula raphanica]
MTSPLPLPDLDAPISIPDILQHHLKNNPTFPIYVYPDHATGELKEITMLEFVRAAYRAGAAVRGDSKPGDVVAIIANLDSIVYMALITGLMNVGLVPFPISPRNSSPAIAELLRKSSARRLLTTHVTLPDVINGIRSEMRTDGLRLEEAPSLKDIFPYLARETAGHPFSCAVEPFIPEDTDAAIYLHSSGSTGFPKAVRLSYLNFKDYISVLCIDDMRSLGFSPYGAAGLPPFHVMAVFNQLCVGLYGQITVCMFPPVVTKPEALPVMLSPENVLENARLTQSSAMLTVPTFLTLWSHSEEAIHQLAKCVLVFYGGGPLPPTTGDYLVSRGVKVVTAYGGTEMGLLIKAAIDPENWSYAEFSDKCEIRWVPQGDGTFEAQFLTTKLHHPAVENIPDVKGYATSDLFIPHPINPKKWKIVGRVDDVIIHSSGEKTVPTPMESIIAATSLIQGVVMFGRERDQTGILVEPSPAHKVDVKDPAQISAFRNSIWHVISLNLVEDANRIAPAFSKIFKEMILIASPDKPLPRVGKGTVARKAALALYESEINEIYAIVESNSGGDSVDPPKSWTAVDVQSWLVAHITDITSNHISVDPTHDLFEQGFDSLVSTILRLHIVGALRKFEDPALAREVPQSVVYSHPTVESLTRYILNLVNNRNGDETSAQTRSQIIEEMIEKYSQGLEDPPPSPQIPYLNQTHHVLLTGSTGNLGAELLAGLLSNDSVHRVYALNRTSFKSSILDRHRSRFENKGLDASLLASPKLVFLEGEVSSDNLGLEDSMFNELRRNLTMVIHNAWRLDFNLSLPSFESHIKGARSLIDLARLSHRSSNIKFLFTSSIASTQSWDAGKGPYPEEVVMDSSYAVGGGYGESKYVTERILARSGLQATSFRIGQICGGEPHGAWATSDWLPILVKSGLTLNKLPDAHGVVSWIPMDAVTSAILDTAFLEGSAPFAVNVIHPRPTTWSTVMKNIRQALIRKKTLSSDALSLIPFKEWLIELEQNVNNTSDDLPALKLLEFFKLQGSADDCTSPEGESLGLTPLKIENVERISQRIRSLGGLEASTIEKWVDYWIFSGF